MQIAKSNSGLVIGALFTAGSLLLTATFIVPMISIFPGYIFESIAKNAVNNIPYSNVGKLTIELLLIMFLFSLILSILSIINKIDKVGQISQRQIVVIMMIMFFFVPSLGFYIYWGVALNFESDGQLSFLTLITFPISSFAFILIGLLIDKIKNRYLAKHFKS